MYEELRLARLIKRIKEVIGEFPDHRTGKNISYEIEDAGMGAFSVFFPQSVSFLAHQRAMKLSKRRSNAESLFEMVDIPSDNQIRSLLDPIAPEHLSGVFREVFDGLERSGLLESWRSFSHQILVALDGTEYFSSKKIDCDNCNHRVLNNRATNYYHSVITPVIVQAGNEHVIALEPEYILPQDGHKKQM